MDEYPILVKPIDYPLMIDALEKCWNCGSNVFRVMNEWCILKNPKDMPPVALLSIMLFCASCGKSDVGFDFEERKKVRKGEFDSREDAERHLHWLEKKKQEKESPAVKVN